MGANDAREQLEAAKAECVRLERALAEAVRERDNLAEGVKSFMCALDAERARALAAEAAIRESLEVCSRYSYSGLRYALTNVHDGPLSSVSLPESEQSGGER